MILYLDTETFSPVPINQGTARYATQVEVILVTWAIDDGPVVLWAPSFSPLPPELEHALACADEIWAHNAYFDRTVLAAQTWFDRQPLEKWRCTMALALAHGLPGALEKLCEVFKIPVEQAKQDGKDLIKLFCVPQGKEGTRADAKTHPAEWKKFCEYAKADIEAMRAIHKKLPKWNFSAKEIALWHLDQTINDRGWAADVEFARGAVRAIAKEKKILDDRTVEITEGAVARATQRNELLGYLLGEYGVSLPDLTADTVERRLNDPELPEFVKELLRIRQQSSKSSSAKYKRMAQTEVAGRMYGTLQFCGANRTGRWGGRLIQPQNFPRPSHKAAEIEVGIEALKANAIDLVTDNVMALLSSSLRGVMIAPPGCKLVTADLSNIEGRKLAWLAGEQWKLDAFAAFDLGEGQDIYKVAYGRAFGIPPEKVADDSDERQIGKVQELALGYEGGVGAFVTMAVTYGVDLELMAQKALPAIPGVILREAESTWHWAEQQKRTLGLGHDVYVVCEALKRLWRNAHPKTVQLWEDLETAALTAVQNPNTIFPVGEHLSFERRGAWLRLRLPSGRYLCYPDARAIGGKLSYVGVDTYSRKWGRIGSYGGKLAENATQASSRDVMAEGMFRAEANGYPIVLTVHDELITEVPDTDGYSHEGLSSLLATNCDWNQGLPLAAKGATRKRYGK